MTAEPVPADDWRLLDTDHCAWFETPSLTVAAALVARIAELTEGTAWPAVDLRPTGVRVRMSDDPDLSRAISDAARSLGLTADPTVLQEVRVVVDASDAESVGSFWQTVLGYDAGDGRLVDHLRRDPALTVAPQEQVPLLRNRIHVDVIRPAEAVDAVRAAIGQEPHGAYGVALSDLDGNEVDLVPGDRLDDGAAETDDWHVIFAAMAWYPTSSPQRASALAAAAAALADAAGVPLMIDLRSDGIMIDSGKDLWEDDVQPPGHRFADLAAGIQAAARDLGLVAAPDRPRFVQLGVDAVDVASVRAFWTAALGYQTDDRPFVTDIVDPRRLDPVIIFQDLDATDHDRRSQRNRTRLDLVVPADQAERRIAAAVAAGGTITDDSPGRCLIADPEGNEVAVT